MLHSMLRDVVNLHHLYHRGCTTLQGDANLGCGFSLEPRLGAVLVQAFGPATGLTLRHAVVTDFEYPPLSLRLANGCPFGRAQLMTNGILPQQSQTAREMWSMFAGLIDQVAVSRFFDVPRRYWLAMGISDGPEHGTARGRSGNLARSCRKIPSRF